MPFDSDLDGVWEALRDVLAEKSFHASRADTILGQRNVMQDVVVGIANADLVVADLTDLNPNVMYELGLAHALDKPVIIITQDIESLPFDLRAYRVLEYSPYVGKFARFINDLSERLDQVDAAKFGSPISDHLETHAPPVFRHQFDVLVRVINGPPVNLPPPDDDEPAGFFDSLEVIEDDLAGMTIVLESLVGASETFTLRVSAASAKMKFFQGKSAREVRVVTREVADALSDYADAMHGGRLEIADRWARIDKASETVFGWRMSHGDEGGRERLLEELDSLIALGTASAQTREQFQGLQASFAGTLGIDRAVDRQGRRATEELESLSSTLSAVISTAARAAALRERLTAQDDQALEREHGA